MARYKFFTLIIVPVLLAVGLSRIAAQVAPATTQSGDLFTPVRTIGQNRPSGLRYDPIFDRFVWVDVAGQLVVVDGATLAPLHVLYKSGAYSAFTFSRNGQLLAVAIDVQVDVWDVAGGVRVASFAPTGALRIQGPLQFTRGDELLLFDSVVPASQDLRRSENDTMLLPWLWDIAAAREQRTSVLVNRVIAYPFYNVRVSMVAGDNGILISGLDNRLQIYDADTPTMQLIADLPANRLETDPIVAYRSANDPYLYVSTDGYNSLVQINTLTNAVLPLTLSSDSGVATLDQLRQLSMSRIRQPIGDNSNQFNPLTGLLVGSDYLVSANYHAALFTLFDVLVPTLDEPGSDAATGTALLAYNFDENSGFGGADAYHPSGINQIALSPDAKTLAFRRQSGEIALYDIASGALLHVVTPSEPDPSGERTFAFTGDGKTLVVDFERFDAQSGALLSREPDFTQPFAAFAFYDDGQLITFGGSPLKNAAANAQVWRLWDVTTGHLLREDSFALGNGDIVAETDDHLRFLTQQLADDGSVYLNIVDGRAESSQSIHLPALDSGGVYQVTPNDDWTRFLVVYGSGALAAYTRDGTRLYFDAGNNLPAGAYNYSWRDDRTIIVQASGGMPAAPLTGIEYAPSGLPQCIVDSLPDTWTALVPEWERFVYQNSPERINDFTRQLCTALTGAGATNVHAAEGTPTIQANVTAVVGMLTPSPAAGYFSARTPAPIAVPGVPTCITERFRSQAAAYADLWRQVTAGVTDPAKLADIDKMICEGLLGDLGYVQPTPTVNPNGLAVTTPTPLPAAPQTTGGDESAFSILTIDVETGVRTFAAGVVPTPQTPQPDALALLNTYFRNQYKRYPNNPVISPDGHFMAAQDDDGFITIYQLSRPLSSLLGAEVNAIAARATGAPRSIGLAPTATLPPQALGTEMPTLTPTMTLTPLPFTQANVTLPQWLQSEMVCPARQLARLPDLPDGFTPPGTLIVDPVNQNADRSFLWVLNPRSGLLTGDVDRPQCGVNENCTVSPDGKWVVRQTRAVVVSRPDGSDAVTLYSPPETDLIQPSFHWNEPHTLVISYNGVLPTLSPDARPLIATYDPETGVRTAGKLSPTPYPLGLLPFDVVSRQPYGTLELLRESFSGGTRYYLRDSATQATTLFAQGDLIWTWQPAGRFLYYQDQAEGITYIYDTLTATHMRLGNYPLPQGVWSPDGHLLANWTNANGDDIDRALLNGDLPARLYIWNTDTGYFYYYCLPELSRSALGGTALVWSPDSRYLAFTVNNLLPDSDLTPTPTYAISPEAPPATSTPIPLETQYEYRNPRTIILDSVSGSAAIVSAEASAIERWEAAQ